MTMLALPLRAVKPSRRRTPTPVAAARNLLKAIRRFETLIPQYNDRKGQERTEAREAFYDRVWFPAGKDMDRAENRLMDLMEDRGVAGIVADGRLFINLNASRTFEAICEYHGSNVVVLPLADIPDVATRRAPSIRPPVRRPPVRRPPVHRPPGMRPRPVKTVRQPAALAWPDWTDNVLVQLPEDEDRSAWAAESGTEWERRQSLINRTFASGRLMGLAGCPLAVPLALGTDVELVDAYVRGWDRGADELEVDQAEAAWNRLQWDERADEAAALDRHERGLVLA